MHDARRMRRLQRAGALQGDFAHFFRRESPAFHSLPQRDAVDQFGGDEPGARGVSDFVDRNRVGMVECRGGARLRLKTRYTGGVRGEVRQDLKRDLATQPGVARAVDLAHGAGAQHGQDLVVPQPGSNRWRRSFRTEPPNKAGQIVRREEIRGVVGVIPRCQQRFDGAPQFEIVGTRLIEHGRAAIPRARSHFVIQLLYAPPPLRIHCFEWASFYHAHAPAGLAFGAHFGVVPAMGPHSILPPQDRQLV
jgi:hypothetical protein